MQISLPIRCLGLLIAALAAICPSAIAQARNAERTQIAAGPYRIAGMAVNARAGNALARCRVTIADAKDQRKVLSVITGDDGRFEFHVPAGKFSLGGAKRGFISAGYNQHDEYSTAIVTGADLDTENLVLRLVPNAVLTGSVLDEFGEPVRNAQIMVYRRQRAEGVGRTSLFRSAMTDDQGRYEVTPLDEGTYFVSAKASPWYAVHPTASAEGAGNSAAQVDSSLDVVYATTFYGDATEVEGAAPIAVHGGDRLEADIHLNPVPALHLIFRVSEDLNPGMILPQLEKQVFDGTEHENVGNIQNISPGVFEMAGIAPGRYSVRMPGSNGQWKEPADVNLETGGELDVSSGRSTSQIKLAVQIEGASTLPAQLQILLRNSKGKTDYGRVVDPKGAADFSDVIAGTYDILAASSARRYSVVRIASEAGMISGHSLNVPAGASLTIALSLVGGSVTVEGFAKRDGKAVSGAMIVLVPKNAEADRDRFRRDESDLDGSFSLSGVIPGSYTVIAIDDGWDLEWSTPAVLAQYLKRGQTFEVGDRSAPSLRLEDAVVVQAK
ncbi:MAG TPA: carboxypeptidase-like regulatory domain-containing protein [Terriglobales bacterium]